MKKALKVFGLICVALLTAASVIHFAVGTRTLYSSRALVKYADVVVDYAADNDSRQEIQHEKEALLGKLGDYDKCRYHVRRTVLGWFVSYGTTIMCRYPADSYAAQKAHIESTHRFLTASEDSTGEFPVYEYNVTKQLICGFSINSWRFRVLAEDGTNVPKDFRMIAENDDTCQIAYLSFHDTDLDSIGERYRNEEEIQEFIALYFDDNF